MAAVIEGKSVIMALTVKVPTVLLAVKSGALAIPLLSLVAVAVNPEAGGPKLPLAPETGAEKVTPVPLKGLLQTSITVAPIVILKGVLISARCLNPPVATILPGGPTRLVRLKLAGVFRPVTQAETS